MQHRVLVFRYIRVSTFSLKHKNKKKMNFKSIALCTLLLSIRTAHSSTNVINKVDDEEFIKLTTSENYIIVLFTKQNCEACDALERELASAHDDLVESLNARIVKIYNSNVVHLYSPTKEPALVFFRYGIPLLYHGEVSDEHIIHTFTENKEPTVKELDDQNFEHLTQVATGTTTGDWFVMFYSRSCTVSRRLAARWEAVGAALRTRMNVARVNRVENGVATANRFNVFSTPSFILFHHGNMYRYNLQSHDIDSFVHFATIGYKKIARSEPVPVPKTPFDELIRRITEFLEENDWLFGTGGFGIAMGFLAAIWVKYRDEKAKKKKAKKNKKN